MFTEKIKKKKRNISQCELTSRSSEKQKSELKKKRKGLANKDIRNLLKLSSFVKEIMDYNGYRVFLTPNGAGEISGRFKQVKRHILEHKIKVKTSIQRLLEYKKTLIENGSGIIEKDIATINREIYFNYHLYKQTKNREKRIRKKNNPIIEGISESGKENRRQRKLSGDEDQQVRIAWKKSHDIITKSKTRNANLKKAK